MEKKTKSTTNSAAFAQKEVEEEALTVSEHLQVTGVSRSGRVQKKSSKLTDFESPDKIDPRYQRRVEMEVPIPKPRVPTTHHIISQCYVAISSTDIAQANAHSRARITHEASPLPTSQSQNEEESEDWMNHVVKIEPECTLEEGPEIPMYPYESATARDMSSNSSGGSEEEEGEMEDEWTKKEEEEAAAPDGIGSDHQATTLYMLEKSSKKKLIMFDTKIVGRIKSLPKDKNLIVQTGKTIGLTNAKQKDKGKTRFTAYMLWAKEIRQEMIRANPDMDFATISKRLSKLWAAVPANEKYNWKRRAKRLAVKGNHMGVIDTARWKSPPARNKFLNKTGSHPVD